MDKFLNQKVTIVTFMTGPSGYLSEFKGTFTSYDDEYVCLDNNIFIVRKYIIAIAIK